MKIFRKNLKCECGHAAIRVISGGFPGAICLSCEAAWGPAFTLHAWGWPFTGQMLQYERWYEWPIATWRWLWTDWGGDDEW